MGYIYSYNENYMAFAKKGYRGKQAKLEPYFATMQIHKCG